MPSNRAHQIAVLLRASRELDVIGDVSVVVDSPGELIAWAGLLPSPTMIIWRAEETGRRYVCLTAMHREAPIRGRIMITLDGDRHPGLWRRLLAGRGELPPGTEHVADAGRLIDAWHPLDDDLNHDHEESDTMTDGQTRD